MPAPRHSNRFSKAVGHGQESTRFNNGGTVMSLTTAQCSYVVNPDGTGTEHVRFNELPNRFTSDLVLVDNAREIHFVLSDDLLHTVASGVAKQQRGTD